MRSWLIVLLVSLVHRDQATETKNQYGTGHLALSGMLHQGNFLMENFEQLRSLPLDLDINKFFTGLTRLNTIFALTNFVILRIKERNTFSLKKAFERLDARMVHIEESLQQELDLISHQTMKTRFFQYELVIRHSLRHCRAYLSTSTDRTREEFINVAKTLKDSMFAIFDGLLNGLAFGSDILALTRDAHHSHRRKFKMNAELYVNLLAMGALSLDIYFEADAWNQQDRNYWKDELLKMENKTLIRIAKFEEQCSNEGRVGAEMTALLTRYDTKDASVAADHIYDYLADKYDTRHWLVIVYDVPNPPEQKQLDPAFHSAAVAKKSAQAVSFNTTDAAVTSSEDDQRRLGVAIETYCQEATPILTVNSRVTFNWLNPFFWFAGWYPLIARCDHYRADVVYQQLKQHHVMFQNATVEKTYILEESV